MRIIDTLSTGINKMEQLEILKTENYLEYLTAVKENNEFDIMLLENNLSLLNNMIFYNGTSISILESVSNDGYCFEVNDGLIVGMYRKNSYNEIIC